MCREVGWVERPLSIIKPQCVPQSYSPCFVMLRLVVDRRASEVSAWSDDGGDIQGCPTVVMSRKPPRISIYKEDDDGQRDKKSA